MPRKKKTEPKSFTINNIMALSPCMSREKVQALAPRRKTITARQIAGMKKVKLKDRHWLLVRLVTPSQDLLNKWVERAIDRVDRSTAPRAWCDWADKWLSGKDRSAGAAAWAAGAAGAAAGAAAWAAEAAGAAAGAAAWAAGEAAWAAGAAGAAGEAAWAAGAAGEAGEAAELQLQIDELLAEHESKE